MKEKGKLIVAILAVILIIIAVVGATYAYWSWTTNSAQQTSVTFTVPSKDAQLSASLNGGGTTTVSNLAPAACTNATYAMKKQLTLTYKNLTTQTAKVKATLTVSNWTQPHSGTLSLNKLHYALTTGSAAGDNCNAGTNRTVVAGGTTSSFVTTGALINDVVILDNISAGTSNGSATYYLWVWLDSSYAYQNTGSVISDPMQDLTFTLTWSGEITNNTN